MNRLTIVGLTIVAILVIVAILAPWIATHDVGATNLSLRYLPPSSQYFFGTDSTGRYVFNVFLAFPGLLLAIAMVAFLGAGLNKLIFALCVIGWVGYARLIRGQVLKVREYDFVQAARALGASDARILFVHILPNAIQPLIVQASLGMAGAVLSEASLSFLGLGVSPPTPSWGVMIE